MRRRPLAYSSWACPLGPDAHTIDTSKWLGRPRAAVAAPRRVAASPPVCDGCDVVLGGVHGAGDQQPYTDMGGFHLPPLDEPPPIEKGTPINPPNPHPTPPKRQARCVCACLLSPLV